MHEQSCAHPSRGNGATVGLQLHAATQLGRCSCDARRNCNSTPRPAGTCARRARSAEATVLPYLEHVGQLSHSLRLVAEDVRQPARPAAAACRSMHASRALCRRQCATDRANACGHSAARHVLGSWVAQHALQRAQCTAHGNNALPYYACSACIGWCAGSCGRPGPFRRASTASGAQMDQWCSVTLSAHVQRVARREQR